MTKLSTNNGLTVLYFLKKLRKNICRYHYFTPVYQKSWWYDLQFLRYRVWQTEIGNYGSFFDLLLLPLKTWKIRILKKNEKYCLRYHHSTHVYQKPELYEARFLRYWVKQIEFFVILGHILPFYPPNNPQNQNFEKMKKHLERSSFYTCAPKITIIWRMLHEIWSATDIIFCHFGPFFAFLSHEQPWNLKFWKKYKTRLEILSFYTCVP